MIQSADIAVLAYVRLHVVLRHMPQREQHRKYQHQAYAAPAAKSSRKKLPFEHTRYHTAFRRLRNCFARELQWPWR